MALHTGTMPDIGGSEGATELRVSVCPQLKGLKELPTACQPHESPVEAPSNPPKGRTLICHQHLMAVTMGFTMGFTILSASAGGST